MSPQNNVPRPQVVILRDPRGRPLGQVVAPTVRPDVGLGGGTIYLSRTTGGS